MSIAQIRSTGCCRELIGRTVQHSPFDCVKIHQHFDADVTSEFAHVWVLSFSFATHTKPNQIATTKEIRNGKKKNNKLQTPTTVSVVFHRVHTRNSSRLSSTEKEISSASVEIESKRKKKKEKIRPWVKHLIARLIYRSSVVK